MSRSCTSILSQYAWSLRWDIDAHKVSAADTAVARRERCNGAQHLCVDFELGNCRVSWTGRLVVLQKNMPGSVLRTYIEVNDTPPQSTCMLS